MRVLTKERYTTTQMDRFRSIWKVDKSTVIIVFDPTAPNIFGSEYVGDNILLGPLRRPFWIELQSRFGNMFYVRDYVRPLNFPMLQEALFCSLGITWGTPQTQHMMHVYADLSSTYIAHHILQHQLWLSVQRCAEGVADLCVACRALHTEPCMHSRCSGPFLLCSGGVLATAALQFV